MYKNSKYIYKTSNTVSCYQLYNSKKLIYINFCLEITYYASDTYQNTGEIPISHNLLKVCSHDSQIISFSDIKIFNNTKIVFSIKSNILLLLLNCSPSSKIVLKRNEISN